MAIKSHPVPKVGDTVCLNRDGLETIFGNHRGLSHMLTLKMKITHVSKESLTAPEETFEVKVDNEEINRFMINHWCFDVVTP